MKHELIHLKQHVRKHIKRHSLYAVFGFVVFGIVLITTVVLVPGYAPKLGEAFAKHPIYILVNVLLPVPLGGAALGFVVSAVSTWYFMELPGIGKSSINQDLDMEAASRD